jgi:hypothetical protein
LNQVRFIALTTANNAETVTAACAKSVNVHIQVSAVEVMHESVRVKGG